jgi:hypothetical protein
MLLFEMELAHYLRLRPRLFHLTARGNLDLIRDRNELLPASVLMAEAQCTQRLCVRRRTAEIVRVEGHEVNLRDQAPLHRGNIRFQGGWSFEEFVAHLNSHVFFWPGGDRPIPYGIRHFSRYRDDPCVVLVADASALIDVNPGLTPKFCRYNSGSPRCSGGLGSPRGTDTFLPAQRFEHAPSRVVETVFDAPVRLPAGGWRIVDHIDLIR